MKPPNKDSEIERIVALSQALRDCLAFFDAADARTPHRSTIITPELRETWKSILDRYGSPNSAPEPRVH